MPRRGAIRKRDVTPDPVYGSKLVTKLVNRSMKSGKKSNARAQIYQAFDLIKEKEKQDPLQIFKQAVDNIRPSMEVRPRRIGGAAYQVPMSVKGARQESLALRWLIQAARNRSSKEYHTFAEKLQAEMVDAAHNTGGAVKKREDVLRMAEANKAFAHFRW
jgi:small subunit ribosomal protein S7